VSKLIVTRAEFQQMADVRLTEAEQLLVAGLWSGAYYLTGYAAELALKACIIRWLMSADEFPARKFSDKCYIHTLEQLFDTARLKGDFDTARNTDPDLNNNWSIVKDWNEHTRYHVVTQREAEELFQAMTDGRHGVLPWIKARW
jgi:HEPN domain-containing protein